MALAIELILVDAISQVDQQLVARVALETGWMPGDTVAKLGRNHTERARRNVAVAPVALLQRQTDRPANNKLVISFPLILLIQRRDQSARSARVMTTTTPLPRIIMISLFAFLFCFALLLILSFYFILFFILFFSFYFF